MRVAWTLTALLIVAGCATNSTSGPEPEINIYQISRVPYGTQHDIAPISTQFVVQVKNTLPEPLTVRRVEVQSIGGGAYTLPSYSQAFNQTIEPGATNRVSLWAPAVVTLNTTLGANGPVTLRLAVEFEAGGKKFQKIEVQNVGAMGE
jgi:hypothetical protein